jgi:hypothetical protein
MSSQRVGLNKASRHARDKDEKIFSSLFGYYLRGLLWVESYLEPRHMPAVQFWDVWL